METVLSDLFDCPFLILFLKQDGYVTIECYDEQEVHEHLKNANKNIFNTLIMPAAIAVIQVTDNHITEWNPILCYSEVKKHVQTFINETTKETFFSS